MKSKDVPLRVRVYNGRLNISIGVDTLAFADLERRNFEHEKHYRILDSRQFAVDTAREMEREDEIGASPLTNFLDDMMDKAIEQGSTAIKEGSPKEPRGSGASNSGRPRRRGAVKLPNKNI